MRLAAILSALIATSAVAAPRRLAVVYGHDGASGGRAALHYAEADARRVAAVLTELGGVAPDDVKLLTGRPVAELSRALSWAKARAGESKESVLFVYVSAHAEAKAGLLPGGEVLPWADLKAQVAGTKATMRVAVVDACESAGLLEAGAKAAPTFRIEAEDRLTVKGEAFITSSASDEPSVEAGVIGGAVFTQHLVAALRGAGDVSKDGVVTLEEAYRYAYARTSAGDARQHPGLALSLSGFGDVPMTSVGGTGVVLRAGLESLSIRGAGGGAALVYGRGPLPERLAVPPGRWEVAVEREGVRRVGTVVVRPGAFVAVDEAAMREAPRSSMAMVRLDAEGAEVAGGCVQPTASKDARVQWVAQQVMAVLSLGPCGAGEAPSHVLARAGMVLRVTKAGAGKVLVEVPLAASEAEVEESLTPLK